MSILFIENTKAAGTTYYVSTTGNDGNTGLGTSDALAWKTIQKAANVSTNGDTVNIMAGIYLPGTGQILITDKTASNEWLTFQNYNNDLVIINGTNCPTTSYLNAVIELRNSKYIRLTGLTINHSKNAGITFYTTPISFIKIDNCTISNCSEFALKCQGGTNNITFEYNHVYNNFNDWSGVTMSQETLSFETVTDFSINNNSIINNRAENIDIKGGGSRGVVCYNTINTTGGKLVKGGETYYGGPGVMVDARGNTKNMSIYNNHIYGNNSGVEIENEGATGHFEYIYVYNNIIDINGLGVHTVFGRVPIGIFKPGASTDIFHHIYIYSNTIRSEIGTGYSILQVGSWDGGQFSSSNLQNVKIVNNIFTTSETATTYLMRFGGITWTQGTSIFTINNNSFYSSTTTMRVYWGTTSYTTSNTTVWGGERVITNPQFVSLSTSNFHLNSTSPCIDVGNSTLVPNVDFDGNIRPQGSGYDVGAYEYIGGYPVIMMYYNGAVYYWRHD
jgi:hypothetical protein